MTKESILRMEQLGDFERPAEIEAEFVLRVGSLGVGLAIQRKRRGVRNRVIHRVEDRAVNLVLAGIAAIADESAAPPGAAWTATGSAKSTTSTPSEAAATESASAKSTAAETTRRSTARPSGARLPRNRSATRGGRRCRTVSETALGP